MSADFPIARDVDFSHLRITEFLDPSSRGSPRSISSPRFFWLALLISFALHSLLLSTDWQGVAAVPEKTPGNGITLRLKAAPVRVDPQPTQVPSPEIATGEVPASSPPAELPAQSPWVEQATATEPSPVTIQPISADELRSIVTTKVIPPNQGIATNVFNPSLRQRLLDEESKPELQRADTGPKTHTDPSGATLVDLGGGKCLRSSVPKPGEVQNWYMTSCGGKSESERVMDRVNQTVNGRRQFE